LSVLIILGVLFTAVAHTLFNHSLKVVKAQTASIAVSLEPIYGSIAAYFLLGEQITLMMVIGGSIVIFTNLWASKTNS
jgi:drug/metabolite transporter (DMT)-like permease